MGKLRQKVVAKYKRAVDKAREALAAPITIYYSTSRQTTAVDWDDVYNEPLDPDSAPINNTTYEDLQSVTIDASTSWVGVTNSFIPRSVSAGEIDVNDVYISCKLADVLIDPSNTDGKTYFDYAIYIDIDGTKVIPKTTPLKYGLGGDRYSCALLATKETNP